MTFKKLLLIIPLLFLSSCNKQVIDWNYSFNKVHVFETGICYEISSWRDYDESDQIQVKIKNYGTCLFHSNQVVLIDGKCPFCEGR